MTFDCPHCGGEVFSRTIVSADEYEVVDVCEDCGSLLVPMEDLA